MDTLEVLVAARAEVAKGWCQHPNNYRGVGQDSDGNVCAIGAVMRVAPFAGAFARRALESAHGLDSLGVAVWNDFPSTTKADVLALFSRAIAAEAVKTSSDPSHVYTLA